MEVCVDNIQAAFNAESGGANRILLCSVLREGGLTPSLGMFQVIKQKTRIPVFVLIRPNLEENYVYNDFEIEAMRNDIDQFKTNGADGFIFSLLKPSRSVNLSACKELLDTAAPLPVTFGRGFDFIISQFEALETIIKLGFKRILTCGQGSTAEKGCGMIRKLILMANNRIIIMPAGGITEFNLQKILNKSKAAEVQINYKSQFFTNKESVKLMLKIASDVQEHKLKQYRLLQNCRFGRRKTDSL